MTLMLKYTQSCSRQLSTIMQTFCVLQSGTSEVEFRLHMLLQL